MNQKTFNEFIIAILIIGFAVIIIQNQMIMNKLTPAEETPLDKLMELPEMQEFRNYQGTIEYLTLEKLELLAQEYPEIYGKITKPIYSIQLLGEKNIIVLYDYAENKIIYMFELLNAEVGQ